MKLPHFKMEGLHMLPSVLLKDMHMVKIDLKDAYLTMPVASDFHPLLAFRDVPTVVSSGRCRPPLT